MPVATSGSKLLAIDNDLVPLDEEDRDTFPMNTRAQHGPSTLANS